MLLVANMSPEYGATMGFFPIDEQTLAYLRETGRTDDEVALVERYAKEQQLFRSLSATGAQPQYTKVLKLDLATVEPSLAGPKRPQRPRAAGRHAIGLPQCIGGAGQGARVRIAGRQALADGPGPGRRRDRPRGRRNCIDHKLHEHEQPDVMLTAGLLAKKAVERGLKVKPHVKTSLAPGSRVVTDYLEEAGLDKPLDQLGFQTVGYGCMTCIGNSGPLPEAVGKAITEGHLVAAAVLSGNRNFEGRINPLIKANYLASPALVVAYALAGTVDIDLLTHEPLGVGSDGRPVYLKDIWPTAEELAATVSQAIRPEMFRKRYGNVLESNEMWNRISVSESELFAWDPDSTYVQEPPFLIDLAAEPGPIKAIRGARVLAVLGDSVTTDHISPAGSIAGLGPCRQVSARARRCAGRLQQLRLARAATIG